MHNEEKTHTVTLVVSSITLILVIILFIAAIVVSVFIYKIVKGDYDFLGIIFDTFTNKIKNSTGDIKDDIKVTVNETKDKLLLKLENLEQIFNDLKDTTNMRKISSQPSGYQGTPAYYPIIGNQ